LYAFIAFSNRYFSLLLNDLSLSMLLRYIFS
jgi:hypothetical protein